MKYFGHAQFKQSGNTPIVIILIVILVIGIVLGVKPIRQKIFRLIKPTTQVTPAPSQTPTGSKNIPAPAPNKSDKYGVIVSILLPQDPFFDSAMNYAGALGIGWIRIGNQWNDTEPKDNSWDFSDTDKYIDTALANGLKVLLFFDDDLNSSFCSAPGGRFKNPLRSESPRCTDEQIKDYITHVVTRYKGKVTHYEIGNEPDLRKTWRDYPEEYAKLLSLAYPTIKSVDPNALVLIGGLGAGDGQELDYLDRIKATDPNYLNNFDIFNYHTYDNKEHITAKYYELRVKVGNKPFWITEVGHPSDPFYQKKFRLADLSYPDGEDGQAEYLKDMLPHILSLGVEKVFWADLVDVPRERTEFCTIGLVYIPGKQCLDIGEEEGRKVSGELKTKKAFDAYQELTQ